LRMVTCLELMAQECEWPQGLEPALAHETLPVSAEPMKKMDVADLSPSASAAKATERQHGFKFRSLLGKLVFPMVCGCIGISFPICKLSQIMTAPSQLHFQALRSVAICLVRTKKEGPICWRRKPHPTSPEVPFQTVPHDEHSQHGPWVSPNGLAAVHVASVSEAQPPAEDPCASLNDPGLQAIGDTAGSLCDSDNGWDIHHRQSHNASLAFLHGGLLDCKVSAPNKVPTSSTEAELDAFTASCKRTLCTRHVPQGINLAPSGPTPIFSKGIWHHQVTETCGYATLCMSRLGHQEEAD
jgi:hypothetical protein